MAIPVSPEERICFFRLCRITLDHIPNVLRGIFKQKVNSKHGHVWSDTTQSGAWLMKEEKWKGRLMATQEQLLLNGDTKDWDPTLVFHTLLYSSLCLLATELKHAQLQPGSRSKVAVVVTSTQTIPQSGTVLIEVTGTQQNKVLISCKIREYQLTVPNRLQLSSPVHVSAQQSAKVYICESDWYVVNHLRLLRNAKYGHVSEASISAGDFQKFVADVEGAYNRLGVQQKEVAELKSIAAEVITEKPIVEVVHHYKELWIKEFQENAASITALKADVSDLRSEQHRIAVSVSSNKERIEQLQGGLEEAHSRWEKTSGDVADLKQKQSEDVGTLSSRTEGCETKLQGALNNMPATQMVVNQANTVNVINISVPNQAPSVLQSVGFPVGSQPPFPQSGISIVTGSSTNTQLLPVQQQYVQPQQTLDANRSRQIPSTTVSRGQPHYPPLPSSVQEQVHEAAGYGSGTNTQAIPTQKSSQHAGHYRGELNTMHQNGVISKPTFHDTPHYDKHSGVIGFTSTVMFTVCNTKKGKEFSSQSVQKSKPLAQEDAARCAVTALEPHIWKGSGSSSGATPHALPPRVPQQSPNKPMVPLQKIAMCSKTPAQQLKEYCDRQRLSPPEYTEIEVAGLPQHFQFKIEIKCPTPLVTRGKICGSKQEAKQSAAQKAIQKLN